MSTMRKIKRELASGSGLRRNAWKGLKVKVSRGGRKPRAIFENTGSAARNRVIAQLARQNKERREAYQQAASLDKYPLLSKGIGNGKDQSQNKAEETTHS